MQNSLKLFSQGFHHWQLQPLQEQTRLSWKEAIDKSITISVCILSSKYIHIYLPAKYLHHNYICNIYILAATLYALFSCALIDILFSLRFFYRFTHLFLSILLWLLAIILLVWTFIKVSPFNPIRMFFYCIYHIKCNWHGFLVCTYSFFTLFCLARVHSLQLHAKTVLATIHDRPTIAHNPRRNKH